MSDGISRVRIRAAARRLLSIWGDSLTKRAVAVAVLLAPDTADLTPNERDKLTERIWRRARKEANL